MRYKIIFFLLFLFWIVFLNRAESAYFIGLGDLPGGNYYSAALDVSADGLIVVGRSYSSSGREAFRWSKEDNMAGLKDLSGGGFDSEARGVSADGSVVVGRGTSEFGQEAFRWIQGGGMVGLSDLPGGIYSSQADDVSADGLSVVGVGKSDPYSEAFIWTLEDGMIGLGSPPGWRGSSNAYGISADGSIIVGQGIWEDETASYFEAVRWTESDGPVGIIELPGGRYYSDAWNISSDGMVVVGRSTSAFGEEAAYWTETTGWVGLGDLPGGEYQSEARDVSADGSVVVGLSRTQDFGYFPYEEAFIWDEDRGMRNLKDVLTNNYGLDLTGWDLIEAKAISDDGLVIVGSGLNPSGKYEAWLADLEVDTDGDGIPDDEDACPDSDLSETVIIDGCDSDVDNVLLEDGCTISDLISECAEGADNRGEFVSAVSHTTKTLKKEGIISGKDKGRIQKGAAKADIP